MSRCVVTVHDFTEPGYFIDSSFEWERATEAESGGLGIGDGGGDFRSGISVEIGREVSAVEREKNMVPVAVFEFRISRSFFGSVLHDQGGLRVEISVAANAESKSISELDEVAGVVTGITHHAIPKPEREAACFRDRD